MLKINSFIKNHARLISIVLISLAVGIATSAIIGKSVKEGFSLYNLIMFLYEAILHILLIYGIAAKKGKVATFFMAAVKVFDAVYFSSMIGARIDEYVRNPGGRHYIHYVNFVSYAIASILIVGILIFFFLNWLTNKHKYWRIVKILILITILSMFVCFCFETINFVKYSSYWFEFLSRYIWSICSQEYLLFAIISKRNKKSSKRNFLFYL